MNQNGDVDPKTLAEAIGGLPEAEKLVATLIWFEGLSLEEAAERLDISAEDAAELHERAVMKAAATVADERPARDLNGWSRIAVDGECAKKWRRYDAALADHYTRYFEEHEELRGEQRYSAKDLESALPPGWGELGSLVDVKEWHRHHLSGKSSQTLAVGLLGVASRLDPSLGWLWEALSPLPRAESDLPRIAFEQPLDASDLGERPRQTAVDILVDDPEVLLCIEVKRREDGIGTCSCGKDGGNPIEGRCARRVEQRPAYWSAASELLGLPPRESPGACPISASYQAVRNAAAARKLAGPDRLAVFGLIYDANNPYFGGSGDWPGWPTALADAVAANADPAKFRFAAASWQDLAPLLPLDDETRAWAVEKHGLSL